MNGGLRQRVLHVIESYGAGSATALVQYVRATPELSHHLLRRLRGDDDHADDGELALFDSVSDLPPGHRGAVSAVRRTVREVGPDVVHAHSSFAGAYVRLALRRGGPLLVYTPHCFATERQDLSSVSRLAYGAVERVLARNTDVFAACSPRELALAARLGGPARRVLVRNVAGVSATVVAERGCSTTGEAAGPVTGMGRLAPQRDPELFVDLVAELRARRGPVPARWIGSGPADVVDRLTAAGIEVTGWLARSEAMHRLAEAGVYVHTARWDAAPMTIVEAQALRLPIVARRTPALVGSPDAHLADDAAGLADLVGTLLDVPAARARNLADWAARFAGHTVEQQADDLRAAYGLATRVEVAS